MLVVSGEISNISGQRRDVPPIRVALLDADRRELDFGLFDPPAPALGPGGASRFEVEMGAPPPEAQRSQRDVRRDALRWTATWSPWRWRCWKPKPPPVAGEVPVGAVLVAADGTVLARDRNRIEERRDPTAHAEMLVIRAAAARLGTARLVGCDLYVTLEPCPMCATAASFARLRRIYFGAEDPKGGGVEHGPRIFASTSCHHRPEVYGGIAARRVGRAAARPSSRPGASRQPIAPAARKRARSPSPSPAARPAPRRCAGPASAGRGGSRAGCALILSGLATRGTVPAAAERCGRSSRMPRACTCGIGEDLVQRVDRAAGDAEPRQAFHPLARGLGAHVGRHQRVELAPVPHPQAVGGEARVGRQVGGPGEPAPFLELRVVADRQDDVAVGAGEGVVGHDVRMLGAAPLRHLAGDAG